ncbi:tyrosine-type recombinase/integrase [Pseudoalteromonas sp. Of7M-16]|uniref:tyrosine-type recombinase/integrase n=1 Tax=Pseudoalteromonas sp. Of7M-16 TaxID=2917756 RepID=UPI001EF59BF9|nr:tyrosine-type recombinase/integrase [Pseudoalteromonas sp. Of7M-16]MCG7549021.1 tyrosine-type recombinase/integrase [Pseudoalteromonas sp. Of7M-16]
MSLTALEVKSITCPEGKKQIKKFDGNGLFLLVKSNGSKLWRMRFKLSGKHKELALGQYPTIPLVEARKLAEEARVSLIQGINPIDERRERKRSHAAIDRQFHAVAMNWWEQQKDSWSADHQARVKRFITNDCKSLSKLLVEKIDTGHITEVMLSIEASGSPKKAPVILSIINRIFGYALAHRLTRHNPAQGLPLKDIIKPLPKVRSHSAIIKASELGKLICDIDTSPTGSFCTVEALKLIPRLFLRPNEIRNLKWEYVDFDDKLIRIPAAEMKKDRDHLVPLSKQVIKQLRYILGVTSYSVYVFPSQRDSSKPMSKNVMTNRLRDLGYAADVMSAHGFRSTASTILHEQGWNHDAIEAQLAHLTGTSTSRAYNRSMYLPERKKMMQEWSDYLEQISSK